MWKSFLKDSGSFLHVLDVLSSNVFFFICSLETGRACRAEPEQAGPPGDPKQNSRLVEFRLKATWLKSVKAKMLQPREKATNVHAGASPMTDIYIYIYMYISLL